MGGQPPSGRAAGVHSRVVGGRRRKETFLIVCEGARTEPHYFEGFRLPTSHVRVVGAGKNTTSLVADAIRLKNEDPGRDHYWCVFDRDSFPAQTFNNALRNAQAAGFRVAYSNECFEIWYLLHFDYHDAALSRALYEPKLSERLGRKYQKNDRDMYDLLRTRQPEAITRARKLLSRYDPHNPEADNPCTTVHELVEDLERQLQ